MGATENAGSDAKLQRNLRLDLWSSFEITKMLIAVSEKDRLCQLFSADFRWPPWLLSTPATSTDSRVVWLCWPGRSGGVASIWRWGQSVSGGCKSPSGVQRQSPPGNSQHIMDIWLPNHAQFRVRS